MKYFDYIMQFEGMEHPFGDLAKYIKLEVESSKRPDDLLDIYEGDSFSDIYDHFSWNEASKDALNIFVQSWTSYLKHEEKSIGDPLTAMVLYQLSQLNQGMEYMEYLKGINHSLNKISGTMKKIGELLDNSTEDRKGETFLRILGVVDTYEQN